MAKAEVEVITSEQRRRHCSQAEKERVVAAMLRPGATSLGVSREFDVHQSQIFRWRQQLCGKAPAAPGFAAVAITAEPREAVSNRGGSVEIELGPEVRIRISGAADSATVSAVLAALRAGSR
jgi:transposase